MGEKATYGPNINKGFFGLSKFHLFIILKIPKKWSPWICDIKTNQIFGNILSISD